MNKIKKQKNPIGFLTSNKLFKNFINQLEENEKISYVDIVNFSIIFSEISIKNIRDIADLVTLSYFKGLMKGYLLTFKFSRNESKIQLVSILKNIDNTIKSYIFENGMDPFQSIKLKRK